MKYNIVKYEIQCKTEHLFLIKKMVAPCDKKLPAYRKKR